MQKTSRSLVGREDAGEAGQSVGARQQEGDSGFLEQLQALDIEIDRLGRRLEYRGVEDLELRWPSPGRTAPEAKRSAAAAISVTAGRRRPVPSCWKIPQPLASTASTRRFSTEAAERPSSGRSKSVAACMSSRLRSTPRLAEIFDHRFGAAPRKIEIIGAAADRIGVALDDEALVRQLRRLAARPRRSWLPRGPGRSGSPSRGRSSAADPRAGARRGERRPAPPWRAGARPRRSGIGRGPSPCAAGRAGAAAAGATTLGRARLKPRVDEIRALPLAALVSPASGRLRAPRRNRR